MDWDEEMSVRRCAGCEHPKIFHRENDGPCSGHPTKKNHSSGLSDDHENVEARKQLGLECWCPAFTDDPKRAAEIILKHGNRTALKRGIDEALDRKDSESAKRLRARLLRETPKEDRDDLWLADVESQLSDLTKKGTHRSRIPGGSSQQQDDPAVWESLRREFERLADAELQGDPNNREDRWLRAYAYDGEGEDAGRVLYRISSGLNERFQEKFNLTAKKAGIALGIGGKASVLEGWLSFVFSECWKHRSKLLRCYSKPGDTGTITRICEASAVCCSRLEQQGAEKSAIAASKIVNPVPQAQAATPTLVVTWDPCSVSVGDLSYSLTKLAGEIVKLLSEDLDQHGAGVSAQTLRRKTNCAKVWDAFRKRDGRRFWIHYIEKPEKDVFRLRLPNAPSTDVG